MNAVFLDPHQKEETFQIVAGLYISKKTGLLWSLERLLAAGYTAKA